MLLFTDMDRTLLAHDYSIPARVRDAFVRARSRGMTIVFVTARAPASLFPIARELENLGLCSCYNGGWIGRLDTGEVFDHTLLSRDVGLAVMRDASALGIEPVWYGQTGILAPVLTPALERQLAEVGETGALFDEALAADGAYKVMCMDRRDEPQLETLAGRWRNEASVAQSHKMLLEVGPKEVSKGTAIRRVASMLGASLADCHAAGDSYNDIPMLQAAGSAFTVANAVDEVKAIAKVMEASCDEGGLADIIDIILAGAEHR